MERKIKSTLFSTGAAICAGVLGFYLGQQQPKLPTQSQLGHQSTPTNIVSTLATHDHNPSQQLIDLKKQLIVTQKTLAKTQAQLIAQQKNIATDDEDMTAAEIAQNTRRYHVNRGTKLDQTLAAEDIDTSWSIGAESAITEAMRHDKLQDSVLIETTCRNSFCRIKARSRDDSAQQQLIMMLPTLLNWQKTHAYLRPAQQTDGSIITTVYLSRDGYDLPD